MWRRLTFNITFFWIIISQVSSSDPLDCDFETGFCNWVQRGNDELDWTRISGAASTNSTGPNGDHTTGDGFYAFIDTRPENIGNRNRAWLISQQKNTGTYCVSFWYYMYGNSVDTLRVSNASSGWKTLFDINGFQGQRWSLKTKTIFSYTAFRLVIIGILTFDDQGSYGIIAIDDILMFPGSCPQGCNDPTPTFGSVDPKNFKPGSEVRITCMTGYTLQGKPSITCQANGIWSAEPKCLPIDCGTRNITNGYFTAVSGTTFGRTAKQSCNVGYILEGPETVECTDSGWNGTGGQCIIIDCGDPTPVSGNVSSTNFQYKSKLEISCNAGYTLVGNSSIICQADGNWSNNPVCNPIDCFTPPVPHGLTSGIVKDTTYNQTVMLDCADGYTLSGNRTITCQPDGNWSSLPECLVQEPSSKPLTILYILGPVVFVILAIIILTMLLRKVIHKNLEKLICFRKSPQKGKPESGNFCNVTYSGHDVETQSNIESNRSPDTNKGEAQNRNEKRVYTVSCNGLDSAATENENNSHAQMENTAIDISTTYSQVCKSNGSHDLEPDYDKTFNRTLKYFKSSFEEQNNRYDYLEVNNLQKKYSEKTQNGIQEDLDPTYDHTHVDLDQINQSEYVNAAVISEHDDEVCYENTSAFDEESQSLGQSAK